jgi:hypothetical protein
MSKIISGNQIGSASRMHVMSRANFQPSLEMLPCVVQIMVADRATRRCAETLPGIGASGLLWDFIWLDNHPPI